MALTKVTGEMQKASIATKTGAYNATSNDDVILCDATSTGFTVTMPAAASNTGMVLTIKKTEKESGSTNPVAAANADTIAGSGQSVQIRFKVPITGWKS